MQCQHLRETIRTERTRDAPGGVVDVHGCKQFGECTLVEPLHGRPVCKTCPVYSPGNVTGSPRGIYRMCRSPRYVVGRNFHRSGWPEAYRAMALHADPYADLILDDFVEQNFCFTHPPRVYEQPWAGIFHHPPNMTPCAKQHESPRRYLYSAAFQKSLPQLRLAISLSDYLAEYLRKHLNCPVVTIRHPSGATPLTWSPDRFLESAPPRLVQPGWYLRNTRAIFQVAAPRFEKVRLWRDGWNWSSTLSPAGR